MGGSGGNGEGRGNEDGVGVGGVRVSGGDVESSWGEGVCDGEVINGEGRVRVSVNPHIRITCKRTYTGCTLQHWISIIMCMPILGCKRVDRWMHRQLTMSHLTFTNTIAIALTHAHSH